VVDVAVASGLVAVEHADSVSVVVAAVSAVVHALAVFGSLLSQTLLLGTLCTITRSM
jgi:hypothetical protein